MKKISFLVGAIAAVILVGAGCQQNAGGFYNPTAANPTYGTVVATTVSSTNIIATNATTTNLVATTGNIGTLTISVLGQALESLQIYNAGHTATTTIGASASSSFASAVLLPRTDLQQTVTPVLVLSNDTATLSASSTTIPFQISGALDFRQHYWNVSDKVDDYYIVAGKNSSGSNALVFYNSLNGGAKTQLFSMVSNGSSNSAGSFQSASYLSAYSAKLLLWQTTIFGTASAYGLLSSGGGTLGLSTDLADGPTAYAVKVGPNVTYTSSTAKLLGIWNNTTEKAYFDINGGLNVSSAFGYGTSPSAGLNLANTTAAVSGTQQYSPSLILEGQSWNTANNDSNSIKYRMYVQPVQSTVDTGAFNIQKDYGAGSWSNLVSIDNNNTFNSIGGATWFTNQVYMNTSVFGTAGYGMYTAGQLNLAGGVADGATAIGARIGSYNALSNASSKLVSFTNAAVEKMSIAYDGTVSTTGNLYVNGTGTSTFGGIVSVGGGSAGHATCFKADGKTIGYCSDTVGATGLCTCN